MDIIDSYITDATTEEIDNSDYIESVTAALERHNIEYQEEREREDKYYQKLVEEAELSEYMEEQLRFELQMEEVREKAYKDSLFDYMIRRKGQVMENIKPEVSESITGLLLNQRDKEQYPKHIQPYLYEDIREEKMCVKLVLKNVEINNKYMDFIMNNTYYDKIKFGTKDGAQKADYR